jgi:hypothetical protein
MRVHELRPQRAGKVKREGKGIGNKNILPVVFERTFFQRVQFPGLRHTPI